MHLFLTDEASPAGTNPNRVRGRVSLILDRSSKRPGPSGGIIVRGALTSTGVYAYPGAKRRDLRDAKEVFARKSLDTLKGATVTRRHPEGDEVNPTNFREVVIGHIGDSIEPDEKLGSAVADVYLNDAQAIAEYDSGELSEISCGYEADLIADAGEVNGEAYTHRQTNMHYNHVALGPPGWGRQGQRSRLLDAEKQTMKIIIDGKEFETEDKAREYLQGQLAAANAALTAEKAEHEKTRKALADAKDPKSLREQVKERAALVTVAKSVLIDEDEEDPAEVSKAEEEIEDTDDLELKKKVIMKAGIEIPADASVDFINGAYALAAKSATAGMKPAGETARAADSKDNSGTTRVKVGDSSRVERAKVNDGSEELAKAQAQADDRASGHTFAMSK